MLTSPTDICLSKASSVICIVWKMNHILSHMDYYAKDFSDTRRIIFIIWVIFPHKNLFGEDDDKHAGSAFTIGIFSRWILVKTFWKLKLLFKAVIMSKILHLPGFCEQKIASGHKKMITAWKNQKVLLSQFFSKFRETNFSSNVSCFLWYAI